MSSLKQQQLAKMAMRRLREKELRDRLKEQLSLMVLNRHTWQDLIASDQYSQHMEQWIEDTRKMVDIMDALLEEKIPVRGN